MHQSTNDSEAAPTSASTMSEERREAIAQALLQVLTEHDGHSSETDSVTSALDDGAFRDQLADFITQTQAEISELRTRVARLEALLQA